MQIEKCAKSCCHKHLGNYLMTPHYLLEASGAPVSTKEAGLMYTRSGSYLVYVVPYIHDAVI